MAMLEVIGDNRMPYVRFQVITTSMMYRRKVTLAAILCRPWSKEIIPLGINGGTCLITLTASQ